VFDFRYHVASLAAVFCALVIGIVVGLGLSGRGFIDEAERRNFNERIEELKQDRDLARSQLSAASRRQAAMEDYAAETYPQLVPGRLEGMRVAMLFVGSVDGTADAVAQAVRDGGGRVTRIRAIRVPVEVSSVRDALAAVPALRRQYRSLEELDELGRDLGFELTGGGQTQLWDALNDLLVEERAGGSAAPVDAVVVARTVPPQQGPTQEFLAGLYRGVARSGTPAVGVQVAAPQDSAIPAFSRNGLSTVDSVDTAAGKLALVLLLSGSRSGDYGTDETASDGVLPPLLPLPER
jgi:hypothetical protein